MRRVRGPSPNGRRKSPDGDASGNHRANSRIISFNRFHTNVSYRMNAVIYTNSLLFRMLLSLFNGLTNVNTLVGDRLGTVTNYYHDPQVGRLNATGRVNTMLIIVVNINL